MNGTVEQGPDGTVSATIRAIASRARSRIRRWFGGSILEQANREASSSVYTQPAERVRIARELPDRALSGPPEAVLVAHAGADLLPAESACRLQRVVDEGRTVWPGLRSTITESSRLEEAIFCFGDQLVSVNNIRYRVLVSGQSKPLKPEVQQQICHIAQEALVNALRHARATEIETEIYYSPRQLRVMVRDNGCGIDPKIVSRANSGLRGMRERAESIGAQLHIWSRPKAGTEVEVTTRGAMLDSLLAM